MLHLVRVWPKMDRNFERSLKGRRLRNSNDKSVTAHKGSLARLCPVCKGKMLVPLAVRIARGDLLLSDNFIAQVATALGARFWEIEIAQENNPGNVSGQSDVDSETKRIITNKQTGEMMLDVAGRLEPM